MNTEKNKKNYVSMHIPSFCFGLLFGGFLVLALIPVFGGSIIPMNTLLRNDTEVSSAEIPTEVVETVSYVTDITDVTITAEDNNTFTFHTPKSWYSLTDQYSENLKSFYNVSDFDAENVFVVGDSKDIYSSGNIITMSPVSSTKKLISSLGSENITEDAAYSDIYYYMINGVLPEDADDSLTVEELEVVDVEGIKFHVYKVGYDTTYYTDDTMTETTVVHTDEISVYSESDDSIEIIMTVKDLSNLDSSLSVLHEFLGVE